VRIAMLAYTEYEVDPRVQRAAEALTGRGHQLDVLCLPPAGTDGHPGGGRLRIFRLRIRHQRTTTMRYAYEYGAFFLWALGLVSLRHARRAYDLVYVHNMPNFFVFAGLLPKLTGAKVVLDVHDPAAELLASIRGKELPPWVERLARGEERLSLRYVDAVVTVNETMRQRLRRLTPRSTPVAVVLNLPDPDTFVAEEPSRVGTSGPLLVYSGSIAHRNGVDLVLKALAKLIGEFPSLRLRVIGDGPARADAMELARALGVSDRVEFRGLVPLKDIPHAVGDALAGVSPQRKDVFGSYVFSMKVAEYVLLGLPVVCSGIGTMRHYFDDDELFFFEPGDEGDLARAIRDLLKDPEAAHERVARSRAKLKQLDWSGQRQCLVDLVESLTRRR
jgi:glycosyltransferase involved in cell wall biosynthesis